VKEEQTMKPTRLLLLVAVLSAPQAALAETADGSGALALAALAGENSPLVTPAAKELLAKLLDGEPASPGRLTIAVKADKLTCKASNVDIRAAFCELVFAVGPRRSPDGTHELFATLAGSACADAGAGSVFEAIAKLDCKIDPNEVMQMSGGGAHCDYAPPN
jgi:hypothetical protein